MKKIFAILGAILLTTQTQAQDTAAVNEIAYAAIENEIRADIAAASSALNDDDFASATQLLRTATAKASRLSLNEVSDRVAGLTPTFKPENANFALARSSTIAFDRFLNNGETAERIFKDDTGRIVTVRVFGEERDLSDFMFIKDDTAMIEKGGLEVAEMMGEPAIKKRGPNGELSVLIMSEKDQALIEIEGDDADAVMAFIGEIENPKEQ